MLSIPHMIVLFVLVLVVFGPQKLPELARTLGKLMAEFRKASTDFRGAFEEEMRNIERQSVLNERKKAEAAAAAQLPESASQETLTPSETAASATPVDAETRETEAPVIKPVAESVARIESEQTGLVGEPPAETPAAKQQDAIHDHEQSA
jgi:sec-independent protein translocase protein TatB